MKLRILFKNGEYLVQRKGWFFWTTINKFIEFDDFGWMKSATFTDFTSAEAWLYEIQNTYRNREKKLKTPTKVMKEVVV